jgi:hypothetical protein
MNEKQQQLTFEKGITNVPSDALCSDNTLEESVGMIYEDGEHRVIQRPNILYEDGNQSFEQSQLLYIHRFGVKERWLFAEAVQTDTYNLVWYVPNDDNTELVSGGTLNEGVSPNIQAKDFTFTEEDLRNHAFKITSTGKTLIIIDQTGISYFLWKNNGYSEAIKIKQPQFEFSLRQYWSSYDPELGDIGFSKQKMDGILGTSVEDQEKYNDLVIGLYSKSLNQIASANAFCKPFLARVALQLFDDSYTYISQPVMLFPCVTENARFSNYSDNYAGISVNAFYLRAKQLTDYTALSDIVKNVSIFISDGIEPHDLTVDQPFKGWGTSESWSTKITDAVCEYSVDHNKMIYQEWAPTSYHQAKGFMKNKSRDDIKAELEATSVFYKLCDIGIKSINSLTDLKKYIKPHTVRNLTTQEQLPYDDYFSRCSLSASLGYSYNNRLNIANVHRGFFEGYGYFLPFEGTLDTSRVYDYVTPGNCDFYVKIETADGEYIVKHTENVKDYQGIYFCYPDSRAKHVWIVKNGSILLNKDLTEHPSLNMAYYFKGLPGFEGKEETDSSTPAVPSSYNNSAKEYLPNYILTSGVDNPFVFNAEGYNSVGIGEVIGMSTVTQALSQGQYGQFPLLVFSESGIWAMSVGNTGLFTSIHPMSREVCNNMASITQTDGAVFFTSEKGLMMVVGADVKCVSEQLSGKEGSFSGIVGLGNFVDYLRTAFIAYDYRDSLLWIFKPQQATCYIYSIKSGTFGKYTFPRYLDNVTNYYPDFIMQDGGTLYSLVTRPNINLDGTTVSSVFNPNLYNNCRLITRPMKLENALALKSIMQIKHICQFSPYSVTDTSGETPVTTTQKGTLTFRLFASNDLEHWTELTSLKSVPWKYYRFRLDFSNLIATDRFAGTMLITQERRINKLR